jgi:hypothetical protein
MDVRFYVTKDYEEKPRFWLEKNKANSKPVPSTGSGQALSAVDRANLNFFAENAELEEFFLTKNVFFFVDLSWFIDVYYV